MTINQMNDTTMHYGGKGAADLTTTGTICIVSTADFFDEFSLGTWDFPCDGNDSQCSFNLTLGNSTLGEEEDLKFWTIVLMIVPMFTVFGNILVVMSVVNDHNCVCQ